MISSTQGHDNKLGDGNGQLAELTWLELLTGVPMLTAEFCPIVEELLVDEELVLDDECDEKVSFLKNISRLLWSAVRLLLSRSVPFVVAIQRGRATLRKQFHFFLVQLRKRINKAHGARGRDSEQIFISSLSFFFMQTSRSETIVSYFTTRNFELNGAVPFLSDFAGVCYLQRRNKSQFHTECFLRRTNNSRRMKHTARIHGYFSGASSKIALLRTTGNRQNVPDVEDGRSQTSRKQ